MAWREDAAFGEVEVRKLTVNGVNVTGGLPDDLEVRSIVTTGGGNFGGGITSGSTVNIPTGNLRVTAGTISAGGDISTTGGNIVASSGGLSAATFAHITPLSTAAINALTSTPDGTIVIWNNSGTLVPVYRSGSNWKKLKDDANQTIS